MPVTTWTSTMVRMRPNQGRRKLIFVTVTMSILYLFLIVLSPLNQGSNGSIPPCGDVCDIRSHRGPGRVIKNFVCRDIVLRMAHNATGPVVDPAPLKPPDDLYDAFTMYGDMPIVEKLYFSEIYNDTPIQVIGSGDLSNMAVALAQGHTVGTYGLTCDKFVDAIVANLTRPAGTGLAWLDCAEHGQIDIDSDARGRNTRSGLILTRLNGTRGFVIGSQKLWIEAVLLSRGVAHVTTLEYATIISHDERLAVSKPSALASDILKRMGARKTSLWANDKHGQAADILRNDVEASSSKLPWEPFDFGFTYSSLEHAGLGRYGDPLDPYGDLEAMAQAWCITRPGGLFFMGLPIDLERSYIVWNAHRIYGPNRIAQMTANWDVIAVVRNREIPTFYHLNTIFVLRKPLILNK